MKFLEKLIQNADLWQNATEHPFIQEMVGGKLDTEDFPEEEQERFQDKFKQIVELETQFFDECYAETKS